MFLYFLTDMLNQFLGRRSKNWKIKDFVILIFFKLENFWHRLHLKSQGTIVEPTDNMSALLSNRQGYSFADLSLSIINLQWQSVGLDAQEPAFYIYLLHSNFKLLRERSHLIDFCRSLLVDTFDSIKWQRSNDISYAICTSTLLDFPSINSIQQIDSVLFFQFGKFLQTSDFFILKTFRLQKFFLTPNFLYCFSNLENFFLTPDFSYSQLFQHGKFSLRHNF